MVLAMQSVYLLALVFAILLSGCAKKHKPITANGKPVGHWLEELKNPDPKARKKAAVALGNVGRADPAAIPALIAVLKDRDATVRDSAVLALLNIGPKARDAIPALTEARYDKDATVRSHAVKAVERVQGNP
jgi:HEAT repeat protein